jgi:hypothetical protein
MDPNVQGAAIVMRQYGERKCPYLFPYRDSDSPLPCVHDHPWRFAQALKHTFKISLHFCEGSSIVAAMTNFCPT